MNEFMKDYKSKPFGGAGFIIDPKLENVVIGMVQKASNRIFDTDVQDIFLKEYRKWITGSKLNKLHGVEDFKFAAQSHGTTQGFDCYVTRTTNNEYLASPTGIQKVNNAMIGDYAMWLSLPCTGGSPWQAANETRGRRLAHLSRVIALKFEDYGRPLPYWRTRP